MLELDDGRSWKIFLKPLYVFNARAAPAIDRLVIVADDERNAFFSGKQPQPGVLNRVRVLKFVDEQMRKTTPVVRQEIGVVAPEFVRAQ